MVSKEAQRIRGMFGAIAPRYDLLNTVLSLNIDNRWRRITARRLDPFLSGDSVALDLCTGTGELALALSKRSRVVGCDFTHAMLVRGQRKLVEGNGHLPVRFVEGDGLMLPFRGNRFSAVTVAFGLRNMECYRSGLSEMLRVLKPGGALAVLEFSQPRVPLFRQLYLFYFTRVLPRLGRLVSRDSSAYSYLPASVREFPSPTELESLIESCGFVQARHESLTGGIASLHLAQKPA